MANAEYPDTLRKKVRGLFRFLLGFLCGLLAFNWVQAHVPILLNDLHSFTDSIGIARSVLPVVTIPSDDQRQGQVSWVRVEAHDSAAKKSVAHVDAMVNSVSMPVIKPLVSRLPRTTAIIELCGSVQSYQSALVAANVNRGEVGLIAKETGGLAYGNMAIIPLYQQKSDGDLANSLTHELTHVLFNQIGIGAKTPTWINEGLAWTDGFAAQDTIDPSTVQQVKDSVRSAITERAKKGSLLPLTGDENTILHAHYNVEGEDYLAVQRLMQKHGSQTLATYLNDLRTTDADQAFQQVYHESLSAFDKEFIQSIGEAGQ